MYKTFKSNFRVVEENGLGVNMFNMFDIVFLRCHCLQSLLPFYIQVLLVEFLRESPNRSTMIFFYQKRNLLNICIFFSSLNKESLLGILQCFSVDQGLLSWTLITMLNCLFFFLLSTSYTLLNVFCLFLVHCVFNFILACKQWNEYNLNLKKPNPSFPTYLWLTK